MRFPTDFVDRVRDTTNIVELIGQYVELMKSGASFRGLCPFLGHSERTPSFFVSDTKQVYHCFGCGKSGNAYSFLRDYQGLGFVESVEYLASRARIALPVEAAKDTDDFRKYSDEKKALQKLNRFVGGHFFKNLESQAKDSPFWQYIENRGLSKEMIHEFKLGSTDIAWDELTNYLLKTKVPMEMAEKLGLIKKKESGKYFDMFRNRLMFPIVSAQGEVLGFGGRALGDDNPKYLNSPESPVFQKGRNLFGLFQTAKYLRAKDEAILVEGYMDLIALYQFGFKNVVAPLGTAFTSDQARLIKRYCNKVLVLFDGDEAGIAAAEKSLGFLLEAGLSSRVLILLDKQDPDDFLHSQGNDDMAKLMATAPDHFLWYLSKISQGYQGRPPEKLALLDKLNPLLEKIQDERLRGFYIEEICGRMALSRESFPKFPSQKSQVNQSKPNNIKPMATKRRPNEEIHLLDLIQKKRVYLDRLIKEAALEFFTDPDIKKLVTLLIEKYCQNPNDFDKLAAYLIDEDIDTQLLTSHIGSGVHTKDDGAETSEAQLFEDCLRRLKDNHFKGQSKQMLQSLKVDSNTSSEKLSAFMEIARRSKGPHGTDKTGI